jgi:hypothetical protein
MTVSCNKKLMEGLVFSKFKENEKDEKLAEKLIYMRIFDQGK